LAVSALTLAATRVSHSAWLYAGLLVLAVSCLLPYTLARILPDHLSLAFLMLLTYSVPLLLTLLLYSGLTLRARHGADPGKAAVSLTERRQPERAAVVLVISALTLISWRSALHLLGARLLSPLSWVAVLATVLLLVSALALAARRLSHSVWISAALLTLAALSLPAPVVADIRQTGLGPPFGLIWAPSIALLVGALLLHSGLNSCGEWQNAGVPEDQGAAGRRRRAGGAAAVGLALGAPLLAKTLHNLYWLTVWDNTDDSMGYLWLVVPVLAALFSGVALSVTLSGRTKLAGFLYSLLIPALMVAVSARAQRVDFRQLTEERGERISQAIETYYARQGHYPQDLGQLTPRYVLSLPGPVIIYGQGWCYDGGDDYYRLGYVYREHWSDPRLMGRIHTAEGEIPDLHPVCEEEIATLLERVPDLAYEVPPESQ
jgi:hypothetical protein